MGIGHGDSVGAEGHHLGIVEVVAEDDGVLGLEVVALEERGEAVALVDARVLHINPARAREDDAAAFGGKGRQRRPEYIRRLGMVNRYFADA